MASDPEVLMVGLITRNAAGRPVSAAVQWPDGTRGQYTALNESTDIPGAIDSYSVTYGDPTLTTYTQPPVARDSDGAVLDRPQIVVT